jgi:hypothetical protein
LSTTNPIWPDPGSNPGRRAGKPATNRLSYGATRSGRYGEVKIFYPTGTRTPTPRGLLARSQSLCQLSYPGSSSVLRIEDKDKQETLRFWK